MSTTPTKQRKVIQIVTGKDGANGLAIFALCDDGTMWICRPSGESKYAWRAWESFGSVPGAAEAPT